MNRRKVVKECQALTPGVLDRIADRREAWFSAPNSQTLRDEYQRILFNYGYELAQLARLALEPKRRPRKV